MAETTAASPLNPIKQALVVIAAYLVAETLLVLCAYLWVFVYSVLIC